MGHEAARHGDDGIDANGIGNTPHSRADFRHTAAGPDVVQDQCPAVFHAAEYLLHPPRDFPDVFDLPFIAGVAVKSGEYARNVPNVRRSRWECW